MAAFPPHQIGPSISVDQETALNYLSSYLSAAQHTPYLLPNARLEPSGPVAGSSNSSVTIHNLKRVEAGLRGEWLATLLDMGDAVPVVDGLNNGLIQQEAEDGALDLDEYQRAQSIEGGDIGPNDTHVVRQEGELNLTSSNSGGPYENVDKHIAAVAQDVEELIPWDPTKLKTPEDRAARKAAKKARKAAEKLTVKQSQG